MQNQMPQNSSNLQQGTATNLQPNRSDLQPGQESDFLQREGNFDQQTLPILPGKLRVGTTEPVSRPVTNQEAVSDMSLVPYAVTAGIVLLFLVVLVFVAIKSSNRSPGSIPNTDAFEENESTAKNPTPKKKKQPRRKRAGKK
jgi:hypothetical protein